MDKSKTKLSKSQRTRIKTLLCVMCGLMVKETVNLNKIKNQIGVITNKPQTLASSHYRRLTRFFNDGYCLRYLWKYILHFVIQYLISSLDKRKGGRYLLMDATCWEFGSVKFHILTLSIVFQGISVPLFFVNLNKKGTSSYKERIRVLQMANLLYPLKGMTLLADREYVGRDWLVDLVTKFELNFIIRLSETDYKKELNEQKHSYQRLLQKIRRAKSVDVPIFMNGMRFRFIGQKIHNPENPKDDLLLLITNSNAPKTKIIERYGLRWQTECLFKCLKSNGFNLQDLGMKNPRKARLMICIIMACYVLCVQQGLKVVGKIQVRKKTKSLYESVFRKGYSLICNVCQKIVIFIEYLIVMAKKNKYALSP